MPFFESLSLLPDDPIMGLPALFNADAHPQKVNLGIGSYKDVEGKPYPLKSVKKAEAIILSKNLNKEYLPIEGDHEFIQETLKLIFGTDSKELANGKIFAAQTLGGTAGLRLGGEFLVHEVSKDIYLSCPSWPNHTLIFTRAGMTLHSYAYYDETTHGLDFEGMCDSIRQMPAGTVILLHASCHNPTGIDPAFEQWKVLADLIQKQKVLPFFDFAYQGIAEGMDADARVIRYFAEKGLEMVVAYSFSKNFGLYGERCGLIAVVTHSKEAAKKAGSQIKQIIRGIYSTPPLHSARVVKTILQSPELRKEWLEELAILRERMKDMRQALTDGLTAKGSKHDWRFLKQQNGMFSFSGLNQDQTRRLIEDYGIYMLSNGRLSIAGLNPSNLDYVIDAIHSVVQR